jgi:hypothetical protein
MPNWCSLDCSINGPAEDIDKFKRTHFRKIEDGELGLDFNTVIPMPEGMQNDSFADYDALFALGEEFSPAGNIADLFRGSPSLADLDRRTYKDVATKEQLLEWFEENRPDDLLAARHQIVWHRKTGFYDSFEWCCANWGTKWNCHDFRMRPDATSFDFSFYTAWSPPVPVFDKLAELHPSLTLSVEWEEPNMSCAGHLLYRDGRLISHDMFEP